MISKNKDKLNFETAGQITTDPAASGSKVQRELKSSFIDGHIVTHPFCYECGSLMILLNDGKLCPSCGRFAPATEGWRKDHIRYSGITSEFSQVVP